VSEPRVVITGIGVVSPIGNSLAEVSLALREDRHGLGVMPEWQAVPHLRTRLAARVQGFEPSYPRKKIRSMGRVSLLSLGATEQAVADAELSEELLHATRTGIAYGSTSGSSSANEEWSRKLMTSGDGLLGIQSTEYIKFMSHTCAANLAIYYGVTGRVISTCSACVSASQAIGTGLETIRAGHADIMICGGAEEMHMSHAAVFDIMYATSTRYNDRPGMASRPFDAERDGLVVGEGAGTLVLERLDHAEKRRARIYGEVLGYGTNCDGTHVTNPSREGMAQAMRLALQNARLPAERIDYINAHATATEVGDIAESHATEAVLGSRVPISSTKSFTGHTLGACGAIEAAFCMAMMRDGFIAPNRTLETPDPRCARLAYVGQDASSAKLRVSMSNNFAFGGINTSLIFGVL
jgi:3-oxoacyl-[acyl-carrier-protein] synthase II